MTFRGTRKGLLTGPKDLTPGERLWAIRRRSGLAQDAAAASYGLGEKAYAAAELDAAAPPPGLPRGLGRLSLPEKLMLARRRAGESLAGAARTLRVSRVTYLAMERRGDPALRRFWERRGFRF